MSPDTGRLKLLIIAYYKMDIMRTTKGKWARPFSIAVILILLVSIIPLTPQIWQAADAAGAQITPGGNYTVKPGENVTFTTFNFHHTHNDVDFDKGTKWNINSNGDTTSSYILATPKTTGRLSSWIGVVYYLNSAGYDWNMVKNLPVNVTFDFTYTLYANYHKNNNESSTVIIAIPYFKSLGSGPLKKNVNCYDVAGNGIEYQLTRVHAVESFTRTEDGRPLTLENCPRALIMFIESEAYNFRTENYSTYAFASADLSINSIRIEFGASPPKGNISFDRLTYTNLTDPATITLTDPSLQGLDSVLVNVKSFDSEHINEPIETKSVRLYRVEESDGVFRSKIAFRRIETGDEYLPIWAVLNVTEDAWGWVDATCEYGNDEAGKPTNISSKAYHYFTSDYRNLNDTTRYEVSSLANGYPDVWFESPYYEYIGSEYSKPGNPPAGRSSSGVSCALDENKNLDIDVTIQTTGGGEKLYKDLENVGVWVDWNGDKDFDDKNELIFLDSKSAKDASKPYDGSLNFHIENVVPPVKSAGKPWMRVVLCYGVTPDAHGSFCYGDVRDYQLDIPTLIEREKFRENITRLKQCYVALKVYLRAVNFGWGGVTYSYNGVQLAQIISEAYRNAINPAYVLSSALTYGGFRIGLLIGQILAGNVAQEITFGAPEEMVDYCIERCQRIIDDPPDMDYKEPVRLELYDIQANASDPTGRLFLDIAREGALDQAIVASLEKYDGAMIRGDTASMIVQAKAVKKYSDAAANNMVNLSNEYDTVSRSMREATSDPAFARELSAMQMRLAKDGFTDEERSYFHGVGMNDSAINDYHAMLVLMDPAGLSNRFADLSRECADSAGAYRDLAADAQRSIDALEKKGDVPLSMFDGERWMTGDVAANSGQGKGASCLPFLILPLVLGIVIFVNRSKRNN
jgi:hypothetical protein